jgi:hypothetical protein
MKKKFLFLSVILSLNAVQAMQNARLSKKPVKIPLKQQNKSNLANKSAALAKQKKAAATPAITPASAKTTSKPTVSKPVAKPQENLKAKVKSDVTVKKNNAEFDVRAIQKPKKSNSITAVLPNNEQLIVYSNQIYVANKDAKGVFIKTIDKNGKFKNFYDKNLVENSKYRVRAKKNENIKINTTKVVPFGYHKLASGDKEGLYLVMQKRKA